jgi:hypothetical protein
MSTADAVQAYLDTRRSDPLLQGLDDIAAQAALRLAHILDTADNASGAANASRELRQQLELLRVVQMDAPASMDELRDRADRRASERMFDDVRRELDAAVAAAEAGDDDGPAPVHAY